MNSLTEIAAVHDGTTWALGSMWLVHQEGDSRLVLVQMTDGTEVRYQVRRGGDWHDSYSPHQGLANAALHALAAARVPEVPRQTVNNEPEPCPYCPTGIKGVAGGHKMSCAWAKGRSGRFTIPVCEVPNG